MRASHDRKGSGLSLALTGMGVLLLALAAPLFGSSAARAGSPAEQATAAAAPDAGPAVSLGHDRLVRRNGAVLEGRIVSLSLSDVEFLPKDGEAVLLVPRSEIRSIIRADGVETEGVGEESPEAKAGRRTAYVREIGKKPYLVQSDLTLSKKEIAERSILRGFVVGSLATMFAEGDAKYIAFPVGFASQFVLAYIIGQ